MRKILIFIIALIIAVCISASSYVDRKSDSWKEPRVWHSMDLDTFKLFQYAGDTVEYIASVKVPRIMIRNQTMKQIVDTMLKYDYFEVIALHKDRVIRRDSTIGEDYILEYDIIDSVAITSTTGVYVDSAHNRLMLVRIRPDEYDYFGISKSSDSVNLHYHRHPFRIYLDLTGYQFVFILNEDSGNFTMYPLFAHRSIQKDSVAYSFFKPILESLLRPGK